MIKIQEIREIIKLVDASTIDEFVYETEGTKIKLKKKQRSYSEVNLVQPSKRDGFEEEKMQQIVSIPSLIGTELKQINEAPVQEKIVTKLNTTQLTNLHKITSPMVGTFYASANPDVPAFVKVGDQITQDTVVCIVEAMKLFNEIEAEIQGEIVEILAKDGQLVEYGQALFLVKA